MGLCTTCSKKLTFFNTPVFGAGKLSDKNTICFTCFSKIHSIAHHSPSKYSTQEALEILAQSDARSKIIINQLKTLGFIENAFSQKQITIFQNMVAENETITGYVSGNYDNKIGFLLATNKRLIFSNKGMSLGNKTEDFGLEKITSIQHETSLLTEITIMASGNIGKIKHVNPSQAKIFCERVREQLNSPKQASPTINQPNFIDQLEKLAQLKEKGILTQAEFDTQKQKLLS